MVDQVAKMKHNAIIGNIGHFDNEIDMAGIQKFPGITRINIKPQVDKWYALHTHTPAPRLVCVELNPWQRRKHCS